MDAGGVTRASPIDGIVYGGSPERVGLGQQAKGPNLATGEVVRRLTARADSCPDRRERSPPAVLPLR